MVCSVPTRNSATLEIVLTDLHTLYHPPNTLPPQQVDSDKPGKDSDHNVVLFAPKSDQKYKSERKKRIVRTRPLPESQIFRFEQELAKYPWEQVFLNKPVDEQFELFHDWLQTNLNKFFPEKVSKISTLDQKWMTPHLKQVHRTMQREFCKHRKSQKYKKLKANFKRLKRKSVKTF